MMTLEHLNLVVKDMAQTLRFYQAAFPHWRIRGKGNDQWYGTKRQWLHFGDDYQYLTFNDNGQGENRNIESHHLGLAHFAFITGNISCVIQRLAQAGFMVNNSITEAPYRKNCYFIDPNGYEVEFVEYLSDVPAERNLYESSSDKSSSDKSNQ
jgi:catechol 2,3-dioxygenase-like lactoylglutathione lyase family enzyme